ncbi:MAG: sugar ABC transporter permease [Vallitaleaceae bacterium]|nr:sugar ABC transporter permease [Vallitaleaceae bacterium]
MFSYFKGKKGLPYLFMIPALALILFVYFIPFIYSLVISLTDWNGTSKDMNFIGLQNFINIFKDRSLLEVLGNTLIYFIEIVVLQNIFGIFTAVLLSGNFKGRSFFRATLFMPTVVCTVAVGFIWNLMFRPGSGPIPAILDFLNVPGLKDILWLGNTSTAIQSIIFVNIWQWTGWCMVIYIAGLQAIDPSLYEACDIDGASIWNKFRFVTLPLLAPSITINIVMVSIGTLKIFDLPFIMTKGGPGHASESLSMSIYTNSFLLSKMGYGTAISLVLFAFILIMTLFQTKYLRKREDNIT